MTTTLGPLPWADRDLDFDSMVGEPFQIPELTDLGRDALLLDSLEETLLDIWDQTVNDPTNLKKGCGLALCLNEIQMTERLTVLSAEFSMKFPKVVKGQLEYERWYSNVSGEARRNPKDKLNLSLSVLVAYQNLLGNVLRAVDKRVNGELKHAEDMKARGKERRAATAAAKAPKKAEKKARKKRHG